MGKFAAVLLGVVMGAIQDIGYFYVLVSDRRSGTQKMIQASYACLDMEALPYSMTWWWHRFWQPKADMIKGAKKSAQETGEGAWNQSRVWGSSTTYDWTITGGAESRSSSYFDGVDGGITRPAGGADGGGSLSGFRPNVHASQVRFDIARDSHQIPLEVHPLAADAVIRRVGARPAKAIPAVFIWGLAASKNSPEQTFRLGTPLKPSRKKTRRISDIEKSKDIPVARVIRAAIRELRSLLSLCVQWELEAGSAWALNFRRPGTLANAIIAARVDDTGTSCTELGKPLAQARAIELSVKHGVFEAFHSLVTQEPSKCRCFRVLVILVKYLGLISRAYGGTALARARPQYDRSLHLGD
ncbi:hypothetical protein V8E53_006948 [Lactarius tabidus]